MSTKPMLFSTEMVRALLEDRKTVTRRVVKPQPPEDFPYCHLEGDDLWYWTTRDGDDDMMDWWPSYEHGVKPPYQPGDILYVRETWTTLVGSYIYRADQKPGMKNPGKWCPSIHMPKEAARIFLRVKGVHVERLQNITAEQVLNEGVDVKFPEPKPGYISLAYTEMRLKPEARKQFADLWDKTIKLADLSTYGWAANPWVWVIEFERISREEALRNE